MKQLIVIGAGGFGREAVDTIRAINARQPTWDLLGVMDDNPSPKNLVRLKALDLPHLGSVDGLTPGIAVAICIGCPKTRATLAATLKARDAEIATLIHPAANIGSAFHHGEGLVSLAGVNIGTNVSVGDQVHLNAHSVLGHDTRLGDFVSVNPNATVSGEVKVGYGSLIGAASVVLQGLTVGENATVGAGACVTKNVPSNSTVMGVPAR